MITSARLQNIPDEVHTKRTLSPEQSLVVQEKIPTFTVIATKGNSHTRAASHTHVVSSLGLATSLHLQLHYVSLHNHHCKMVALVVLQAAD